MPEVPQQRYLSYGRRRYAFLVLLKADLFQRKNLARDLVPALEHHPVRPLSNLFLPLVLRDV